MLNTFSMLWTFLVVVVVVLLLPSVSAYSSGILIAQGSPLVRSLYCGRPSVHRSPFHLNMTKCGGYCPERLDTEDKFSIQVSDDVYWDSIINVTVTSVPGSPFTLKGFAVSAINTEGTVVGKFLSSDNLTVSVCNKGREVEGNTVFHTQAQDNRTSVSLRWTGPGQNFNQIRFRAWIVHNHDTIFRMDSKPIHSLHNGSGTINLATMLGRLLRSQTSSSADNLLKTFEDSFLLRHTAGYPENVQDPFKLLRRLPRPQDLIPSTTRLSSEGKSRPSRLPPLPSSAGGKTSTSSLPSPAAADGSPNNPDPQASNLNENCGSSLSGSVPTSSSDERANGSSPAGDSTSEGAVKASTILESTSNTTQAPENAGNTSPSSESAMNTSPTPSVSSVPPVPESPSNASSTPESVSNASSTPESGSNASSTPESPSNASSTPESPSNASSTPESVTNASSTTESADAPNPAPNSSSSTTHVPTDTSPMPASAGDTSSDSGNTGNSPAASQNTGNTSLAPETPEKAPSVPEHTSNTPATAHSAPPLLQNRDGFLSPTKNKGIEIPPASRAVDDTFFDVRRNTLPTGSQSVFKRIGSASGREYPAKSTKGNIHGENNGMLKESTPKVLAMEAESASRDLQRPEPIIIQGPRPRNVFPQNPHDPSLGFQQPGVPTHFGNRQFPGQSADGPVGIPQPGGGGSPFPIPQPGGARSPFPIPQPGSGGSPFGNPQAGGPPFPIPQPGVGGPPFGNAQPGGGPPFPIPQPRAGGGPPFGNPQTGGSPFPVPQPGGGGGPPFGNPQSGGSPFPVPQPGSGGPPFPVPQPGAGGGPPFGNPQTGGSPFPVPQPGGGGGPPFGNPQSGGPPFPIPQPRGGGSPFPIPQPGGSGPPFSNPQTGGPPFPVPQPGSGGPQFGIPQNGGGSPFPIPQPRGVGSPFGNPQAGGPPFGGGGGPPVGIPQLGGGSPAFNNPQSGRAQFQGIPPNINRPIGNLPPIRKQPASVSLFDTIRLSSALVSRNPRVGASTQLPVGGTKASGMSTGGKEAARKKANKDRLQKILLARYATQRGESRTLPNTPTPFGGLPSNPGQPFGGQPPTRGQSPRSLPFGNTPFHGGGSPFGRPQLGNNNSPFGSPSLPGSPFSPTPFGTSPFGNPNFPGSSPTPFGSSQFQGNRSPFLFAMQQRLRSILGNGPSPFGRSAQSSGRLNPALMNQLSSLGLNGQNPFSGNEGPSGAFGNFPGQFPGQFPGGFPGSQGPGQFPGQFPGGVPGSQGPGQFPGQFPGGFPGSQGPGQFPGQFPGSQGGFPPSLLPPFARGPFQQSFGSGGGGFPGSGSPAFGGPFNPGFGGPGGSPFSQ